MSAIKEGGDHEPVNVLFALYDNFSALDLAGPLEVLSLALHDKEDGNSKAFDCTFAANSEHTLAAPTGASFRSHIDYKEALTTLKDYDVLVIPGGTGALTLLASPNATTSGPYTLMKKFAELQTADPSRERTLLTISTATLLLAQTGLLCGLAATTAPQHILKLENTCKDAASLALGSRTDVMDAGERYVVNNARFDLGENPDENPYIYTKHNRKGSVARKGSMSWKASNSRRESNARRAAMKLGGLRVITTGGSTAGIDASLYLVGAMVSDASAKEVARELDYKWNKGVVVDSIDV